jgi:dehydrogenase/reductase SDR family member 12
MWNQLLFSLKGMYNFRATGKFKKSNWDVDFSSIDISSKSYIVTGGMKNNIKKKKANSGLGKATAEYLSSKGATVHMVCRNKERGYINIII